MESKLMKNFDFGALLLCDLLFTSLFVVHFKGVVTAFESLPAWSIITLLVHICAVICVNILIFSVVFGNSYARHGKAKACYRYY
jgi:hypothetical protein